MARRAPGSGSTSPSGRPTAYSADVEERLIHGLVEGNTLTELCTRTDLPAYITVYRWRKADPDFDKRIARAQRDGMEARVDRASIMAHTTMPGEIVTTKKYSETIDGKTITTVETQTRTEDMLGHRRLAVDTDLKIAGMLNSRFAQKTKLVGGDEDDEPVNVRVRKVERAVIEPDSIED